MTELQKYTILCPNGAVVIRGSVAYLAAEVRNSTSGQLVTPTDTGVVIKLIAPDKTVVQSTTSMLYYSATGRFFWSQPNATDAVLGKIIFEIAAGTSTDTRSKMQGYYNLVEHLAT
jgi:hypothetical protein